jgi:hypothetical protein
VLRALSAQGSLDRDARGRVPRVLVRAARRSAISCRATCFAARGRRSPSTRWRRRRRLPGSAPASIARSTPSSDASSTCLSCTLRIGSCRIRRSSSSRRWPKRSPRPSASILAFVALAARASDDAVQAEDDGVGTLPPELQGTALHFLRRHRRPLEPAVDHRLSIAVEMPTGGAARRQARLRDPRPILLAGSLAPSGVTGCAGTRPRPDRRRRGAPSNRRR